MSILYLDSFLCADDVVYKNLQKIGNIIQYGLNLKKYVRRNSKDADVGNVEFPFYSECLSAPQQNNETDCGLFVVDAMVNFMRDPLHLIGPDKFIKFTKFTNEKQFFTVKGNVNKMNKRELYNLPVEHPLV